MEYIVKILDIKNISENIKKIKTEKPKNYAFISGQHTLISINKIKLKDKKRPFSFSSSDKNDFLEFIIKIYNERNGITKEFNKLKVKDGLIIGEPKGKISYKGKGIFIAAGTGITPFISIIKSLNETEQKNNLLIYSNGTKNQIILEKELRKLFNNNAIFILSREKKEGYKHGHIDKDFLKTNIKNFSQNFYLCGPFKLVSELKKILIEFGVKENKIVSEI